ncbi:MAG: 2-octaprenyl-6-methoxyphenyl hydroxylase [Nevskia sp.]|nr:2-octaprenyl-6-methoxyphenyl hydroxylase [Nevskia sp.]
MHCDIAIVGGGLVGASLAVALAGTSRRVLLIEAAQPPATAPAWDERCIALNDASRRIFEALGIWRELEAAAEPIRATHISERGRFGAARFTAADAGLDALGYNVPLRALGAALWQRLRASNVELLCPARVTAVTAQPDWVALQIAGADASTTCTIHAQLLAAADGAQSAVRAQLGIGAQTRDYAQHAVVSAVRLSRAHGGVAYERFTSDGPLALIPKPGSAASLVWTLPTAQVEAALAASDDDYLQRAQAAFGGRLGNFVELGRRFSYPLSRVVAESSAAPRVALLGNAAQSLHPIAAQGFNLGLRDVAALAGLLDDGGDPGAAALLAEFSAARASDRKRVSGFTDLLVRTFSNRVPGLMQARHWGLVAVDLLPGLRESVLRQHLGHLGLPPARLGSRP